MMKKLFAKRLFSFLLVFAVLFGGLNVGVFAESASNSIPTADSQLTAPNVKSVLNLIITTSENMENSENLKIYLTDRTEIESETIQSLLPEGYNLIDFTIRDLTPEEQIEVDNFEYFKGMSFENEEIEPQFIDTIFDIGSLSISLVEFVAHPTLWNGFNVVMDGAAVVLPGVPSINGAKRMIEASSTLASSLKIGISSFSTIKNKAIPSGWQRHHIFEKRFAANLGVNENDILSMAIPYSGYHEKITALMRSKYPYGTNWSSLPRDTVIDAHINAYTQLFKETNDPVFEFLAEFSRHRQVVAHPRSQ